jgi:hypothetical protein
MTRYSVTAAEVADKAAKARKKGSLPANRLRIEGAYLSIADIARELGVTEGMAARRIRALRSASGPITLERLRNAP